MPKYIMIEAKTHVGGPYLVMDAHADRMDRYVGVLVLPPIPEAAAGHVAAKRIHRAENFEPMRQVVEDHSHYRKEIAADTLTLYGETEAHTLELATASLVKSVARSAAAPPAPRMVPTGHVSDHG